MLQDYSRADLLALTPDRYLADGYCDVSGAVRPELTGEYATAAATQLRRAEASPQEVSLTAEAVRQLLPLHMASSQDRLVAALEEALTLVARTLQQGNNEGLVNWLSGCAAAVRRQADIDGFLAHLQAVERQYAILAALQPPEQLLSSAQ